LSSDPFTWGRDRSLLCHAKGSRRDFGFYAKADLGELRSATGLITLQAISLRGRAHLLDVATLDENGLREIL
jgi:hypothetical protein